MDLLGDQPPFDLFSVPKGVYAGNETAAPQFIGDEAVVEQSILAAGCRVLGAVKNTVLSTGVVVEEGAVVKDAVLMNGVRVGKGARVEYAILDEYVEVPPHTVVGGARGSGHKLTVVGREE